MAGQVDGDNFVGQDSDGFGDGTTDADTRFLSTRAENRLDGNARYMWERGAQVSYEFFASFDTAERDIRPFASLGRSALLYVPWEVSGTTATVRVRVWAEVKNKDGGTTGEVRATLQLGGEESSATWTATGGFTEYEVELTAPVAPGLHPLALWIESAAEAEGSSATASGRLEGGHGIEVSNGGTLDSAISETSALDVDGTPVSVLHKSAETATPSHYIGLSSRSTETAGLRNLELSALYPLSAAIEVRYDDEEPGRGYTPKKPRTMQAQEPALGRHVSGHASSLDAYAARPKCKALGPHGQDQGEDWPTDHRRKWSWVNVTDESETLLDRQSVQLRHDGSTLRCIAYLMGFWQARLSGGEGQQTRPFQDTREYLSDQAVADLKLEVTASQLQGTSVTSWSDAVEVGSQQVTEQDFQVLREGPQSNFHLPSTVFWGRHPDGNSADASEYRYAYHDGQLWPDDVGLFAPITIDVEVGDNLNRGDPIRCDLDFDGWSGGAPDATINASLRGGSETVVHLLCLQTSWWEVPSL